MTCEGTLPLSKSESLPHFQVLQAGESIATVKTKVKNLGVVHMTLCLHVAICAANIIEGAQHTEADRCLRDYVINLDY